MNRYALLCALFLVAVATPAQSLKISAEGRFITYPDGRPFFYLGDTAWELFHRSTREEAVLLLENRAAKGINVIQAVVLAELDGLNTPNSHGDRPLIDNDPARPNEAYFRHVDFIVDKAQELGMFIGMLPTWGDKFNVRWGVGPEVFTPENARLFGRFLGARYRDKPIIWILGGDRNPEKEAHFAIVRAMAEGVRQGDGGAHLITYHPMGGSSSATFFHDEDWLDFNMFQSGHGEINNRNYRMVEREYERAPVKPALDGEPCYEDHPINWNGANGWFDEFDSRRAGYWGMLAGACGHTYGNHNIWQMWLPGRQPISQARTPWTESLDYPGAFQAGFMRRLFESRPWQQLRPGQSILAGAPNTGGREVRAAIAREAGFLFVYTPYGSSFTVKLDQLEATRVRLWWFNPRLGAAILVGDIDKPAEYRADPPADEAPGNDWVLVVDDLAKGYGRPGER
jgi:hypothetical protein